MKKITMCIVCVFVLLSLLHTVLNYSINGDDFQKDPKVMLEIYDSLPIPERTREIDKKDISRPRTSVFWDIYYHTDLPNNQIMSFYVEELSKKGWEQIEYRGGKGILFQKNKWKIAVNEGDSEYNLEIFKFYGISD
ncbi:hypothetical protein SAMN05216582_12834 [Selenomonas ruminantium]|uniref:Uncharacterized protein n=1 Tax=Selenomonas ruminantium TaxID=971 RepID=A0A1M6WV01_SELRU|nr:hypothetical protein [Selenomonas ruminantium]SHK97486.1 hypothetical protein SAMN05216582_12834 [Selenomonas ruminantium]